MNNLSEESIAKFLLIKLRAEGSVTLSELKRAVRAEFDLNENDLSPVPSRPNELRYEQRCRNLIWNRSVITEKIKYKNQVFTLI